jgi:type II secretory pathway component PulF
MDLVQLATLALGAGFVAVVLSSLRQRRTLEFRARLFELIGTAARRGLPLAPVLRRMGESTAGGPGRALRVLAARLDEGEPLGEALEESLPAGTVPAELLATIHSAEGTAALQPVLRELAENAAGVQRAQDRLVTALAYPSLLAVGLIGTYATTESLLDELPAGFGPDGSATAIATHVLAILLWTALTVALLAQSNALHGRVRDLVVRLARRTPGCRELLRIEAASRVLRVAGALSSTGLPLGDILRRAAHATRHGGIRHGMLQAARAADEGGTPAEVWARSGLPDFAIAFASLAVGAAPAEVGRRLCGASLACERRVARGLARTLGLVQPVAIAVLGALVALHFGLVIEHVQSAQFMSTGDAPW